MTIARRFAIVFGLTSLVIATRTFAQSNLRNGVHDGWIEETNGKTLPDDPGRAYLDPASVHRGDDGLVYFNESTGVTKADDAGHTGFMKNAYDCAKDLKYMCVGQGDWRNDVRSTIKTSDDPALAIYRKYLCGDDARAKSSRADSSAK